MVFSDYISAQHWMCLWSRTKSCVSSYQKIPELILVKCIVKNPIKEELFRSSSVFGESATEPLMNFWKRWSILRRNISLRCRYGYHGAACGSVYVSQVKCLE